MQQYRFSKSLKKAGLSAYVQNRIASICQCPTAAERREIHSLCYGISELHGKTLYEFLTNNRISAAGIEMKYQISHNELYNLRNEFFKQYARKINIL